MRFKVLTTTDFKRDSKGLFKKYRSLKTELHDLITSLEENPTQGTPIGRDCFKIRVAVASKGKGKSGGARVITHIVYVADQIVYLVAIYDKSEKENISRKELEALLSQFDK